MATRLETIPYQVNLISVNSYLYQQTVLKKEAFPWILQELYAPPQRISRPCYINEPIIIPFEAVKQLPDPRLQWETIEETTSTFSELDQILNQELEASTSLSEINDILRQLEADETVPSPNYTEKEETKAWTFLDLFGTITMDET